jgi:hypothetical protein
MQLYDTAHPCAGVLVHHCMMPATRTGTDWWVTHEGQHRCAGCGYEWLGHKELGRTA